MILLCGGLARAADRPNILLFTADDLHAESLGVYGGRVPQLTPNLDAFAAQGMLFNRAHVNAAICAPCRAIIATGRYSHRSGAMGFMKAREDVPDLVTTLRAAGFVTGILGKVGHSTPKNSMRWDYQFDREDLGNGRSPQIYYQRSKTFFELSKSQDKPFYFMVNSHDPHRPYCNPRKLLKGAEMPSRTFKPSEVDVPGFLPDLPGVRAELAHYLNSTRRLDDTFGRVMHALDESGFAESTLVVFMSDNGIAVPFAKCNSWFHSSRTPLLVRWPHVTPAGSRNNVDFVSTIDLFPTFLDVTKVSGPPGLDGRSFLRLLQASPEDSRQQDAERRFVFTQIDCKAGGDAVPMRCVQDGKYGYIYNPFSDGKHRYRNNNEGKCMAAMNAAAGDNPQIADRIQLFRYRVAEELYDLQQDPNCLHNLAGMPEHRSAMQALQTRLVGHMRRTQDPMLAAFQNRDDRTIVDRVMLQTYGPLKPPKKQKKQKKKSKGAP